MCGYLIWILKLCTDFEFVFAEFRPGEPWKGYPNIDPETDPYVTPGSVINSLSINTVREVDHLRDRNSGTWGMGWCENAVQQCGMVTGQDGLALTLTWAGDLHLTGEGAQDSPFNPFCTPFRCTDPSIRNLWS